LAEIQGLSQSEDVDQVEAAAERLSLEATSERSNVEHMVNVDENSAEAVSGHVSNTDEAASSSGQSRQKKPNRQKARLARRAAEQEAQAAAAAEEAQNLPDRREQEITAMKQQMEKLGLKEILIRPDGHCLFSACAHSMSPEVVSRSGSTKEPYRNVRYAAAEFMEAHPNDFVGFLEEPIEAYARKIKDTAEWGGQLELQAIAKSYNVDINVLQADGRIEKITSGGSEDGHKTIWLAYYRHSFGLGEHYNALNKA
jgi:OTU domain-containing protein 6